MYNNLNYNNFILNQNYNNILTYINHKRNKQLRKNQNNYNIGQQESNLKIEPKDINSKKIITGINSENNHDLYLGTINLLEDNINNQNIKSKIIEKSNTLIKDFNNYNLESNSNLESTCDENDILDSNKTIRKLQLSDTSKKKSFCPIDINKCQYDNNIDDNKVINIINYQMLILKSLNPSKRIDYLNSRNIVKEFKEIHNYSLGVYLLEGYIVKKIVKNNAIGNYMFKNEINGLYKLRNYNHFPKLFGYYKNFIYMSYCGPKINSQNIPDDWEAQIEEIKFALSMEKTNPDDMILRNICVLNNSINIIDFGLNTNFTSPIEYTINKLCSLLKNLHKNKIK